MKQENKRFMERRRYIRLPFETEVKYKLENSKDEMLYMAKSNNISAEGLCLTLKRHVEIGTILSIQVIIKELPPCSVRDALALAVGAGDFDEVFFDRNEVRAAGRHRLQLGAEIAPLLEE